MDLNAVANETIDAAMKVHTALGPGLLEATYEACLAHELRKRRLSTQQQLAMPVHYDGTLLDIGYRIDLLIDKQLVVELKAVDKLLPIHGAQLLTYLRLGSYPLGFVLNFNTVHLRDGIKRVINSRTRPAISDARSA